MSQPYTFERYAQAVIADLPALLSGVSGELGGRCAMAARARLSALERVDQGTLHDLLLRPAQAAVWTVPLQAELAAAVQAELKKPQTSGGAPARDGKPAIAPALFSLSLKDDQEVEEEIELARLIQHLESAAESVLRDLRPLAAALRLQAAVTPQAALLHPQACASALGRVVRALALSGRARVACLHVLAECLVPPMRDAYARQLRGLKDAGVAPAQFRVRLTPDAAGAAARSQVAPAPPAAMRAGEDEGRIAAVLSRLVSQAQADIAAHAPQAGALGAPAPHGSRLPREAAEQLMQQLLQTLSQESRAGASMQQVFQRMVTPAQRLASREPGLWQQHEHPWWQLLDRLIALCEVLEEGPGAGQETFAARYDPIVTQFVDAQEPDAELCLRMLNEVDTLARTLAQTEFEHQSGAHKAMLAKPAGLLPGVKTGAAADTSPTPLHGVMRDQMAQQLRHSSAPASVRRFLLGPWVQVLVHALEGPAADAAAAQRYSVWVDGLLSAVSPAQRDDPSDVPALLDVARAGLQGIGLEAGQVDAWLFDLTMRLSDARAAAEDDTVEAAWRHDELPTVPIDLEHGGVQGARARRDREAWLRSLSVGDICRVFLDTQWHTLQLVSIDEQTRVYVLQGRDAAEPYRCTRSALERLRGEGLATTVEMGSFIARAMDTLVDTMISPLAGSPALHTKATKGAGP